MKTSIIGILALGFCFSTMAVNSPKTSTKRPLEENSMAEALCSMKRHQIGSSIVSSKFGGFIAREEEGRAIKTSIGAALVPANSERVSLEKTFSKFS